MHRVWAPERDETKDAMNEVGRTSDTPYFPVTTVKDSRAEKMRFRGGRRGQYGFKEKHRRESRESWLQGAPSRKVLREKLTLEKRIRAVVGRTLMIPRICPFVPVPWDADTCVPQDAHTDVYRKSQS
jgi:hypothetical protein